MVDGVIFTHKQMINDAYKKRTWKLVSKSFFVVQLIAGISICGPTLSGRTSG